MVDTHGRRYATEDLSTPATTGTTTGPEHDIKLLASATELPVAVTQLFNLLSVLSATGRSFVLLFSALYNRYVVDPSLCRLPLRRASDSSFRFGSPYNDYVADPSWFSLNLRRPHLCLLVWRFV